jgi:hypothetical protein
MSETTVIRPAIWRPANVIPLAVLAGIFIMTGLFQPSSAVVLLVCFVLVFLMAWARTIPVRLEITETEVRARQGRWRGQPDVEAPRARFARFATTRRGSASGGPTMSR